MFTSKRFNEITKISLKQLTKEFVETFPYIGMYQRKYFDFLCPQCSIQISILKENAEGFHGTCKCGLNFYIFHKTFICSNNYLNKLNAMCALNTKNNGYKLFLDDERFPVTDDFTIIRSFDEAKSHVLKFGCPNYISFDHDLGDKDENKTGYAFAKLIVELDLERDGNFIPTNFQFYVHSQNSVGAKNIQMYLENYLKIKGKDTDYA